MLRQLMREERAVKLLSLIDILEPLSDEELRELVQRCPDIFLQGGKDLYRPEKHYGGLFLIKEGRMRVYATTPSGKEITLASCSAAARLCGPAVSRPCTATPCTSRRSGRAWWLSWNVTTWTTSSSVSPRWA